MVCAKRTPGRGISFSLNFTKQTMMGDRPTFPRRNIKGKNFKNTRSSNDGKNTQTERSKVVIRTLPASLRNEDDLKEALGGEWLGKINWIRLIPGSEGYERIILAFFGCLMVLTNDKVMNNTLVESPLWGMAEHM